MKKTKAVVFDCAGTVVDDGSRAPAMAFYELFKRKGIEPTMAEVRKPMGKAKLEHIIEMLQMPRIANEWLKNYGAPPIEKDIQQMYVDYEAILLEILPKHAAPKDDTLAAVESLKRKDIKIATTTGYNQRMMDVLEPEMRKHGFNPDLVLTPDSVSGRGRPHPDMILRAMKEFGISDPAEVIKVGDTEPDIYEGLNANVKASAGVIIRSNESGLTTPDYKKLSAAEQRKLDALVTKKYESYGADAVIKDLSELDQLL